MRMLFRTPTHPVGTRILSILAYLLLLFMSLPATQAAEKIRISVSGGYNMIFLSAGVAHYKGFFKDEGLDADIVVMGAAPSIAALTNGDIDYTMLTGTVIRAAIRGLPVRLVAGLLSSSPHVLLARPEIKSVKELSGKKVGLAGFGDATHVLARLILARNGIDPEKEVQFVPLGSDSGRFAGLQQKLADAVVTSPPLDFEGKKLGYNILARAYEYVNYPLSGVGVNIKSIEQNRDQVKKPIRALIKASRFIRENREEAVKVLMAWAKAKSEHAYASYDATVKVISHDGGIPADGLNLLIDQAKKDVKITREIPLSEIADFTILREVQKELGLR
ncbi:MAG TPA: ABC transporter substrate-binding protein [Verrucomicrobiae bacterium]|nr:ABC transporter substrate-binding protein [Verrucomicrobiae bacterium]